MPRLSPALLLTLFYFLLFILFAQALVFLFPYADDDSYIHLRVVQHLLQEGLPYFNTAEAIKTSTSSAWTLVLAAYFSMSGFNPILLCYLQAALAVGVIALATAIFARRVLWAPLKLALLMTLALGPVLSFAAFSQMESNLAILLMLVACYAWQRGHVFAFLPLGMAAFVRLETLLFTLLLLAAFFFTQRGRFIQALLLLLAGALPFLLYDLYFFQGIIPQSITAKSLIYQLSYSERIGLMFMGWPGKAIAGLKLLQLCFFLLLALGLVYSFAKNRNSYTEALPLFFFSGFLLFVAYLLAGALVFRWYLVLFLFPLILGSLYYFLQGGSSKVLLLCFILFLLPYVWHSCKIAGAVLSRAPEQYSFFKPGARVRQYLQTAGILYQRFPQAQLMTSEIGGIAYAFRGKVLDGCGLISREPLRYHPMKVPEERSSGVAGAIPAAYIADKRPEILLSLDLFCEAFARSELARKEYVRIGLPVFLKEDAERIGENSIWGSKHLNLYIRKDVLQESSRR